MTSVSCAGERISAAGAESGTTSTASGGGTSAIAALTPRALHDQLPLALGVNRPVNRRSVADSLRLSRPCTNMTAASGSDACPSIKSSVPRGTRIIASPGNASLALCRYGG